MGVPECPLPLQMGLSFFFFKGSRQSSAHWPFCLAIRGSREPPPQEDEALGTILGTETNSYRRGCCWYLILTLPSPASMIMRTQSLFFINSLASGVLL